MRCAMSASIRIRIGVLATAASLALMAGSALGQSAPGGAIGSQGPSPMGGSSSAAPARPAPNPLTMEDLSKIKGSAVYDSTGQKLGSVSTILMKPGSKTIDRFVIGQGGVLGVGSHNVAVPIDDFKWDSQKDGFTLAKTADDLKAMPDWQEQVGEAPATAPSTSSPSPTGTTGSTPATGTGGSMR